MTSLECSSKRAFMDYCQQAVQRFSAEKKRTKTYFSMQTLIFMFIG